VPFISLILACYLAKNRFMAGYKTGNRAEYVRGVAELASGAAACFPGTGTAISLAIDLFLLQTDVWEALRPHKTINTDSCGTSHLEITWPKIADACWVLGLSEDEVQEMLTLNKRHLELRQEWRERIQGTDSRATKRKFEKELEKVEAAYEFLLKHNQQNDTTVSVR